jgi:LacI family transcriptional regulator
MERQARTAGAFVTVSSTQGTLDRQLETVRLLRSLRPRALVLTSSRFEANALEGRLLKELLAYESEGGRVVIVGATDMPFSSIRFDDHGAGRLIGAHIARSGHRRVAILGGPPERGNMSARVAGFAEGLRDGDVTDIRVVGCEVSRQGGFDAATRLVGEGLGETDAVLAVNDVIAVGALSALRAQGIDVPSDVSLTGIDDIQLSSDVTPRLTTVALPLARVGTSSIRLALGTGKDATHLNVRGKLMVRESTADRTRQN